jgi:hypothetical protein
MKMLLLAALLGTAAAAPLPSAPATPPDYSGAWTLDKAQSPGLPSFYANVSGQRLAVAQTGSRLVVDVEIDEAGASQPERFRFEYALDGTETTATSRVRTQDGMTDVPTRLRAAHGDDGRLHISITRELPMRGQTVTATGTEAWELSADGRTLTVHRVEQMPRGGEVRFDMVFVRAPATR